jgi:hypothetical protein
LDLEVKKQELFKVFSSLTEGLSLFMRKLRREDYSIGEEDRQRADQIRRGFSDLHEKVSDVRNLSLTPEEWMNLTVLSDGVYRSYMDLVAEMLSTVKRLEQEQEKGDQILEILKLLTDAEMF